MVALFILMGGGLVMAPLVISLVALSQVQSLKREVRELREGGGDSSEGKRQTDGVTIAPRTPKAKGPEKKQVGFEFLVGGKAAAFAGIGILVIGIVLLVGYAIQNAWIGPGARTVFGLLVGCVLVGTGCMFARMDDKFRLFSRVLIGGGSSLFYFTVYAAYEFYHLIGPTATGAGLLVSALVVFGAAVVYNSQAIGVLGVLGAFVAPLLISGGRDFEWFLLVYAAVVNVPVILLGVRRRWQVLYNLAFLFTVFYFGCWSLGAGAANWVFGCFFALLFFAEYALLGFFKLRSEQRVVGRTVDVIRLILASLFVIGAVYGVLYDADLNAWIGFALLLLALLHAGLAWIAYTMLNRFRSEITAFVVGGLLCFAVAIPAQLDGEWVVLCWALQGVVLAWFAGRVQSRALQAGAMVLGMLGIINGLVLDDAVEVTLFLNARFVVGMLSAMLLGVQGWLADRQVISSARNSGAVLNLLALAAGISMVSLELMRSGSTWGNPAVTIFWAVCALSLIVLGMKRRRALLRYSGLILFVCTTVKVLFVDSSELRGIERIAAFIGTGVLLLILSFAYQKTASYFRVKEDDVTSQQRTIGD